MEEEKEKSQHRERTSSYEAIPPNMSELRLVLLGNSSSGTCSVGNFILDKTVFRHSDRCEKSSGQYRGKNMVLVKTPDLLHPDLPEASVSALMEDCVKHSAPGPHVFILVLQPEDFTEQQKTRLQSVLENFGDQAFRHSLLLLLPPRRGAAHSSEGYRRQRLLKDLIKQCRFRYVNQEDMEQLELITRVGQIVKENNGEHVSSDGLHLTPQTDVKVQAQTDGSGLNLILLGNSWSQRSSVGNLLLKKTVINTETKPLNFQTYEGEMHNQPLTVVNTPDLQDLDISDFTDCIRRLSGPLVFLLVLQPADFTEKHKNKLCSVLQSCSDKAFDQSLVLIPMAQANTRKVLYYVPFIGKRDPDDQHIRDMVIKCKYRYLNINSSDDDPKQEDFTREELFTRISQMLKENKENLSGGPSQEEDTGLNPAASEENRPCLNLVLCGRAGAEKSSVVESIFGQGSVCMSPEQCVGHQGKVCERWVSLLELPPLSGSSKPEEELMEQCLRFLSRCGPQGVQAFILVLPLGPLTDENKSELRSIQEVFSSAVCPFTIILFTVDSDSYHPDVEGTDLQELCQPYAGHLKFNTRARHQVDLLLDSLETFAKHKPHSYTTATLIYGQRRMITTLQETQDLQVKRTVSGSEASADCLRITLVGRTGHGKSSSGNTILGRKQFHADFSSVSVTQSCEKAEAEVDGRHITVVDTPGLFDNRMSNDDVIDEMTKCISLLAPGPHVFLLVLELGRFTEEMNKSIDLIKESFGKESQKYTMILFTHGDKLKGKISIEEYMRDSDSSLKKLLSDCGNRFHLFNNEDQTNDSQVKELLKKIDAMVEENGGGCFTNDMFQHAEVSIKKEMERIMKEKEEEMRREREEMERKYQQEMEDIKLQMEKKKEQTEKDRKQREQELREKEQKIKMEEERWKEMERIVKEKEEEMRREREKMERKYQQEMEDIKLQMEKQKEQTEKDRKQREQELREKEEKIKMEEERWKEMERNMKEKEEKMRREREEMERKCQQEMEEIKQEMEKQKEQMETEIKQREQELKEKEEKIKMEEELRKKEQEKREEEETKRREQEERQRQELEQRQKELEEKIKSESESKEAIQQKLEESRRKMEEQREKWEKEKEKWWQQRKEENEEKEKQSKAREKLQRQEWKQKQKDLEEKIKSESELKEATEQRLQESRRKMEEQREKWEKEREEWWQKRKQEEEEKQQYIKILREEYDRQRLKDQEQRREEDRIRKQQEEEMERKYQQEMEDIKLQMEKQKEQTEKDRKQREQELREKEEKIQMEEKQKKKDQEKREDEEKQQYLKNLREEYDRQRLKDQEQQQEEDRIRKLQEEANIKELKKKYEKEIEDSKKASEKEARTRAEEEFQRKEKEKLEDQRKHINDLVKCICRKKHNVKRINEKIKADEEQMSKETDEEKKEALLKDQEKELRELIQEMLEEEDDSLMDKLLRWFR